LELESPEQHPEPLRGADLPMGFAANALRLLPAPEQRVHEGGQLHVRGEGPEGGVQEARGAVDRSSVDVDLGQALPVEEDQGVEEIEENGLVGHDSGFRLANPSSIPCQNRTASSPSFQQRFTIGPRGPAGPRPGKSTRPVSRSFTTPPMAWTSSRSWRTSMPRPSRRSARAFQSIASRRSPPAPDTRARSSRRRSCSARAWP